MPVKLTIQGNDFICKDTTAAAKIVDLIAATATPVSAKYLDSDLVRKAHNDEWQATYATKLTYKIEPMRQEVYESLEELDATIKRIEAVATETVGIEE